MRNKIMKLSGLLLAAGILMACKQPSSSSSNDNTGNNGTFCYELNDSSPDWLYTDSVFTKLYGTACPFFADGNYAIGFGPTTGKDKYGKWHYDTDIPIFCANLSVEKVMTLPFQSTKGQYTQEHETLKVNAPFVSLFACGFNCDWDGKTYETNDIKEERSFVRYTVTKNGSHIRVSIQFKYVEFFSVDLNNTYYDQNFGCTPPAETPAVPYIIEISKLSNDEIDISYSSFPDNILPAGNYKKTVLSDTFLEYFNNNYSSCTYFN